MKALPARFPSQPILAMSVSLVQLLERIDLCNNGYIFTPTGPELRTAEAHPEIISIRQGRIYRASTPTELYQWPSQRHSTQLMPECDFEGAILDRQECRDLHF